MVDHVALGNEISTDPKGLGYAAHVTSGSDTDIARLLNEIGIETIDRTQISIKEIGEAVDYAELENLTQGKANAYAALQRLPVLNPKLTKIRNAFNSIFTVGAAPNSRAALIALLTRPGSRAEYLFGDGTVVTHLDVAKAQGRGQ